jgi:hypothetical protein
VGIKAVRIHTFSYNVPQLSGSQNDRLRVSRLLTSNNPRLTLPNSSPSQDPRVALVAPPEGVSNVADEVRRQQHGELRALDKVLLNSEP